MMIAMMEVIAINTRQETVCVRGVCTSTQRIDIETVVLNNVLTISREMSVGFPLGACEDKQV